MGAQASPCPEICPDTGTGSFLMSSSRATIIVFARDPRPGMGKSRLRTALADHVVDQLYRAMVHDVIHQVGQISDGERWIFYTGSVRPERLRRLAPRGFGFRRQYGRDLGKRMAGAIRWGLQRPPGRVILLGTDCVGLSSGLIERAIRFLDAVPIVLGPARDGGFYLFGSRVPVVWPRMAWGEPDVLTRTRRHLRRLNWKWAELPERNDVDTLADFRALQRGRRWRGHAPATAALLERCIEKVRKPGPPP